MSLRRQSEVWDGDVAIVEDVEDDVIVVDQDGSEYICHRDNMIDDRGHPVTPLGALGYQDEDIDEDDDDSVRRMTRAALLAATGIDD